MKLSRVTRQLARSLLIFGGAGALLLLLFVISLGATAPAQADGAIIRVPVDYATIQEAINAAQDGDEIRIQGGPESQTPLSYMEHLTITKGITLSGGWSEDFGEQSSGGHPTVIDAEDSGRAISITGAVSTTRVTIQDLIIINGDATGLGGWTQEEAFATLPSVYDAPGSAPTSTVSLASIMPAVVPPSVGERQAQLADLLTTRGDLTGSLAPRAASVQAEVVDCGGAIYSVHASLHLIQNVIAESRASRTGDGYGGGVCIVTAPAGGVVLRDNYIKDNQGTERGNSQGGGLFIADAPAATLTRNEFSRNLGASGGRGVGGGASLISDRAVVVGNAWADNTASIGGEGLGGALALQGAAATVMSNSISYNLASGGALGLGGALAIDKSPAAQITGNRFANNLASGAGRGIGGGLYIAASAGLRVERNAFTDNTAGAAPDINGTGGGAYVRDAADIVFRDNDFTRNLSSLYRSGLGGGLYLYHLTGAVVQGNRFTANWAAVYAPDGAGGGGLGLGEVDGMTLTGNTFERNVAALYTGGMASGHGGGIYAVVVRDSQITANTFTGNTGSWSGAGKGGGLATSPDTKDGNTERLIVADNTWLRNVGTTGTSSGAGGAIELRAVDSQIVRNRFEGNRACSGSCAGRGGTMYMHGWLLCRDITVDRNIFLDDPTQPSGVGDNSALEVSYVDAYTITNNLLVSDANYGAGAVVLSVGTQLNADASSHSWVVNNTIVGGHAAPGIAVMAGLEKDNLSVVNNILVNHTVGITVGVESEAQTVLSYNLFDGNGLNVGGEGVYTHTHPITGPAAFVDPAAGNFRIRATSAARDAGDPAGVPPAPDHDADGKPRPFGRAVDIGAYEWPGAQVFLPVVRQAGVALDTANWTQRTSPTRNGFALMGITYGRDTYVAVGLGGIILASADGLTWTSRVSGTTVDLLGIEYINATFYVVGGGGTILTSQDGANWNVRTLEETQEPLASIAYGNNTYIIVGGHQAAMDPADKKAVILTSPDGHTWALMKQTQGLTLSQVAFGNGLFVVVSGSSKDTVFTSADGTTWTERPIPGKNSLYAITYGNGRFVAVGENGVLLTSPDGIAWTVGNSGVDRGLYDGIYVQNTFIVVGSPLPGQTGGIILVSTDGVTWSRQESGQDLGQRKTLRAIAYGSKTNTLIAVGHDGMIEGSGGGAPSLASATVTGDHGTVSPESRKVAYQGDVAFLMLPDSGYKVASITDNGAAMAVSSPYAIRNMTTDHTVGVTFAASADPLDNWSINSSPVAGKVFLAIATGNNTAVAVGTEVIAVSHDGITWTDVSPAGATTYWGVAYGNGAFVAVGVDGTAMTSADGANWTKRYVKLGTPLIGVTYGHNLFVAVGNGGTVYTSPDGITWTWRRTGVDRDLVAVTYGHDKFVAVGTGGAIVTSEDGITWTRRNSGTSIWLSGIAYGNQTYIAVADRTILTSADGITWQVQGTPLPLTMTGVKYLNNAFVIVGSSSGLAGILTSPDGSIWSARNPLITIPLWGCEYVGNRFIAVGGIPTSGKGAIIQTP